MDTSEAKIVLQAPYPNQAGASIASREVYPRGNIAQECTGARGAPQNCAGDGAHAKSVDPTRPTKLMSSLALMAEADPELESLLTQRTNRPLHLL